jgi:sensor domain CHASE-containing protein
MLRCEDCSARLRSSSRVCPDVPKARVRRAAVRPRDRRSVHSLHNKHELRNEAHHRMDSTRADSRVATKEHGNPWPPRGESWKWRSLFGSRLVQAGLAILAMAAVSLAFHDPFDLDDRPNIERLMKLAANSVRADVAANMEARISAQVQLARPEASSREWELAAKLFLTQHPGYVGLELIDETYRKRRMAVLPQEAGLDQALEVLENVRLREMLAARSSVHEATATPIKLQDGRPGYLIVVPSFAEEKLAGFLVVACDVKQTLDSILSDQVGLGYSIAVLQDSDQLYLAVDSNSENRKNWSHVVKVPLPALNWQVEVWPNPQMLAEARSQLPELGAIFALLLLLLLGATIHLARTLQVKSAELIRLCSSLYYRVSGWMLMRPFGRISFHSCYDSIAEHLELHDTA